jgi:hypothetical protein
VRNGADVLLKDGFYTLAGPRGPVIAGLGALALCAWAVVRDARGRRVEPRFFALMLAESLLLAASFGVIVGGATATLLHSMGALMAAGPAGEPVGTLSLPTQLMLSLGAGLYEELVFRVILVSLVAYAARRVLGLGPRAAGAVAVVIGAVAFSAFHYVGPYGDQLTAHSFVFRTLAGLAFSALYLLRGFGITAWTHALYDVGFFLF